MSNGKHSLSSLLCLAAVMGVLGGGGKRRGPPEFGDGLRMTDGLPPIDQLEDMMFKLKSFEPMPEDSREAWDSIRKSFNSLEFEDVEGLFLTIVTRDPDSGPANTETCGGCGEVHSGQDIVQMVAIIGDSVTMQAALRKALNVVEHENGRIDPFPNFRKSEEVN